MKFLMVLMAINTCLAAGWVKGTDVEKDIVPVYTRKSYCEKTPGKCYRVYSGFKSSTHKLVNGVIVEDATKKATEDAKEAALIAKIARIRALDFASLTVEQKNKILKRLAIDYLERERKEINEL